MRRTWWGLCLGFALAVSSGESFALEIGYNDGWIGLKYQTWLTGEYDRSEIETEFRNIKLNGGSIVRLWFFQNRQGLQLAQYAPQTSSIDPQMLKNLAEVMDLADRLGLRLYFTLFDGNTMPGGSETELRDYYYNLLNNKYGEMDAFNQNALLPVLQVLAKNPNVIYALDLMNEIEAPVFHDYWTDHWNGPRRWMKSMRDFVRAHAPFLRVTSSAGWDWGPKDVDLGFFSGLGLDFYDIHVYDNDGDITRASSICSRAERENMTVILGEFGQSSKRDDDELQRRSTLAFLQNAQKNCFTAALAWRFSSGESYWNFQRADGSFRPAVEVMKSFTSRTPQVRSALQFPAY